MNPDLALALRLADAADEITMRNFLDVDLAVEMKADSTPVTEADRGVERALRAVLAAERPADAIIGEEYGGEEYGGAGLAPRCWIIDPVDGTKNFVRGVPVWATLIAMQTGGAGTVGVVSAPALNRRWWASAGEGAYADGRAIRVSAIADLRAASFGYSSINGWDSQGRLAGFLELSSTAQRTRAFGDFWSHMLVAEGAFDLAAEPEVSLWDLAAVQVIVTEAGGQFTDLAGVPTAGGGSAVSSNGLLHAEALRLLAARPTSGSTRQAALT